MDIKLSGTTPGSLSGSGGTAGFVPLDNTNTEVISNESAKFASGAKRSEIKPSFHLIPPEAKERLAIRYTMGAEKYGMLNYLVGINDPAFVRQLIDHLEDHLEDFKINGCLTDDNLAAIMWAAATLIVVETYNPTILTEGIFAPRRKVIADALAAARAPQNLFEGKPKT